MVCLVRQTKTSVTPILASVGESLLPMHTQLVQVGVFKQGVGWRGTLVVGAHGDALALPCQKCHDGVIGSHGNSMVVPWQRHSDAIGVLTLPSRS